MLHFGRVPCNLHGCENNLPESNEDSIPHHLSDCQRHTEPVRRPDGGGTQGRQPHVLPEEPRRGGAGNHEPAMAFTRVLESADGAGTHCSDPAQEAQVALAALQAFAQRKVRRGMNAFSSYTVKHIREGLTLFSEGRFDVA